MLIRAVARLKKSLKLQHFIFKFGSFVLGLSFVSDPVGLFLFSFYLDATVILGGIPFTVHEKEKALYESMEN